jgi:hypothetical protein
VVLFTSGYIFFKSPFEFYFHYPIFICLAPIFLIKQGFPKFVLKILLVPILIGILHLALNNNSPFTFIKISGGILLTLLFYYGWLRFFKFDVLKIFEWYCWSCWVLVLIGIFQIISFFIGFEMGYDFSWFLNKWSFVKGGLIGFRVNSILSEPTYLATSLSPAIYISTRNLVSKSNFIFNKYQSIVILLIAILTTSSIGFLGILFSILLSTDTFRLRYLIMGIIISFFTFTTAYNYVDDFKSRVDAAIGLWIYNDFALSNTNNSSFVLYNNLHVAQENLKKHPIFGTGLGSHETAFKRHTLTKTVIQYDFEFNIKDGNSLFIRLCTETGLLGLSFILLVIVRGFIYRIDPSSQEQNIRKQISQAFFVLIVLILIRQGNYMLNGLPLVFLLYYYNSVQYKDLITKKENI